MRGSVRGAPGQPASLPRLHMLSDEDVRKSISALFDAMEKAGAAKIGGMVVYADIPISLSVGNNNLIDNQVFLVSFIHDKNWPKFYIEQLDEIDFHTEFSTRFQNITYTENDVLAIKGRSERFPSGYILKLYMHKIELRSNA